MTVLSLECCAQLIEKSKPCAKHLDQVGKILPGGFVECPDQVITRQRRHFGIPIRDGGRSHIRIRYCPWCGQNLILRSRAHAAVLQSVNSVHIEKSYMGKRVVMYTKTQRAFRELRALLEQWATWHGRIHFERYVFKGETPIATRSGVLGTPAKWSVDVRLREQHIAKLILRG